MPSTTHDRSSYWDTLAKLEPGTRILDYGCGYGRSLAELAERGFTNTVGIDFSRQMIARGRREWPNVDLRLISQVVVDEGDNGFDAAMLIAVLTCISEDEAQAAVLSEVRRLLRPGGLLFISDMPLQDDVWSRARYIERERSGVYGVFEMADGGVVRHHDENHRKSWLCGFDCLSSRRVPLKTMNGNDAIGIQLVARKAP